MEKSKLLGLAMAVALALPLAACGGGGADVKTETHNSTVGQELLDLERARDQGVISRDEYERQRELILRRYE